MTAAEMHKLTALCFPLLVFRITTVQPVPLLIFALYTHVHNTRTCVLLAVSEIEAVAEDKE